MRNAAIRRITGHLERAIVQLTDEYQHSLAVWLTKANKAIVSRPEKVTITEWRAVQARAKREQQLMSECVQIRRLSLQITELQATVARMRDELSGAQYSVAGVPLLNLEDCVAALEGE